MTDRRSSAPPPSARARPALLVAGTALVAGASTLLGIGGDAFMVPMLAAWGPLRKGNIHLSLVPRLLPLAVVFAIAGVFASLWVEANVLKLVFGGLLVGIAIKVALERSREHLPGDQEPDAPS